MHAEAGVRTGAERHVRRGVATDVEAVGIREVAFVVVRRAHEHVEVRARGGCRHRRAPCRGCTAREQHERRLPAQALLDGHAPELGILAYRVELVRMGEEPEQQTPERAVGRLDPRRQQQSQECEELLVGEVLPVDLGLDELGDEIVRAGCARRNSTSAAK